MCCIGFHEPRSRCQPSPCFKGVSCMEIFEFPGYHCGPCPEGMTGNGTHCQDLDEVSLSLKKTLEYINTYTFVFFLSFIQCSLAQPCYAPGACVNTVKGFRCEHCPPGYWGKPVLGVGLEYAKNHKQVLTSIHNHSYIQG